MTASPALDSLSPALTRLATLQQPNGCWEGEVVWCPMILAQYIIVQSIVGREIEPAERSGMIQHFRVTRIDGMGWGLHQESAPYVFVTTLAYVALRLLGVRADDPLIAPARKWLRSQDVTSIPTWGKFWLCLIGLYEYQGMNPIPPELFLAPKWLPLRTDDLYCHTRHIYRAMAYLYGCRFRADLGNILADLRRELYTEPYEQIRFSDYRHALADSDVYVRPGRTLRFFFNVLSATEHLAPTTIRRRALERCASGVLYQQRQTEYQALSPVDGMLNTLVLFERKDPEFARSLAGLEKWRWESEDEGIRYAGARSISWDTAFAMRATLEFAPAVAEQRESLRRAYRFLCGAQLTEEIEGTAENGRDPVLGGWCFSDGKHRWPVSDCTAEAISALLAAHDWDALIPHEEQISQERLRWAAYFLLSRQNAGGGFGTYERRRGSRLLEWINPSEMFGQCMTELSYIECTSSCVQALLRFRAADPQWHAAEIDRAIAAGCRFLRAQQRPDGSFAGFWGINFTYAAFFVTEALLAAGAPADDAVLYKAAHWLLARQLPDGGWGEHWRSCLDGAYRPHERSQVVMTSWALLALLPLVGAGSEAVQKAVEWLAARQKPDGSWPSEAVNGVFFGAAMLDYRYYRVYFPAWALARYARLREAAFRN